MTELKVKFTKGFVKRAAAVAMAVCLGTTLLPANFAVYASTENGEAAVTSGGGDNTPGGTTSGNEKPGDNTPNTVAVTGVTVAPTAVTLDKIGATATLTATVAPANATNKNVTWATSNDKVATVANGTVTATGDGEATITVTTQDGNKTATATVTVKTTKDEQPVDKKVSKVAITLNGQTVKGTLKAKVGKTYSFKATVTPKDAKDKKVKWSTSNKKIATVDSKAGVYRMKLFMTPAFLLL